jgi:hypothetical protein
VKERVMLRHKLGELTGYTQRARDGEIGELEQIYFDDHYWIAPPAVIRADEDNNRLEVDLTRFIIVLSAADAESLVFGIGRDGEAGDA